jgi:hypothetical protein
MRSAPEADLWLLPPLLALLPVEKLLLASCHLEGEALLRTSFVLGASGGCLRALAACVACTDTLQLYRGLRELHLNAGVLERLYPGDWSAQLWL